MKKATLSVNFVYAGENYPTCTKLTSYFFNVVFHTGNKIFFKLRRQQTKKLCPFIFRGIMIIVRVDKTVLLL
jgi:hypothetical protein